MIEAVCDRCAPFVAKRAKSYTQQPGLLIMFCVGVHPTSAAAGVNIGATRVSTVGLERVAKPLLAVGVEAVTCLTLIDLTWAMLAQGVRGVQPAVSPYPRHCLCLQRTTLFQTYCTLILMIRL